MPSCLIDETIIIKLVPENNDATLNKDQDGYLKLEGTLFTCDVPLTSNGVARVLTEEEQLELELALDKTKKPGWLSPTKMEDNVWKGKNRFNLVLGVEPLRLHLKKPLNFIKYAIARANVDLIARSFDERLNRNTFYYMEKESEVSNDVLSKYDRKMSAYTVVNEIKDNRGKLLDMLLVLFKGDYGRINREITIEQARSKVYDFLEKNLDGFLMSVKDANYPNLLLFYLAVASGAIEKSRIGYNLGYSNMESVGASEGDVMLWIEELKNDKSRQETFLVLKQRIKDYKDRR